MYIKHISLIQCSDYFDKYFCKIKIFQYLKFCVFCTMLLIFNALLSYCFDNTFDKTADAFIGYVKCLLFNEKCKHCINTPPGINFKHYCILSISHV